ncbi:hypothetical protein ACHQM5_023569 [Ranunculus cassubicifolius]
MAPSPKNVSNIDPSAIEEGKITSQDDAEIVTDALKNSHKVIAELVGTYILIFAGCGSNIIDSYKHITVVGVSLVWGMAVLVLVYSLGHVSGAHFNPAITIAFAVSRKFPWKPCITLHVLYKHQADLNMVDLFSMVTKYSGHTSTYEAFIWEFIISFILMFVVCGVATDHRAVNELSGVAVGSALLLNIIIAGPVTGASMNPARSIGPAIVTAQYEHLWVYILAPVLGTIAATMIYSLIRVPVPDKSEETTKIV